MSNIELQNVVKRYGSVQVVHGVDLNIEEGEFVVLLGPSGCGKTTTLRMVAGLEDVSDGVLKIGGKVVNDVAPKDRGVAMVFQNYALYPHMSVRKNMEFALRPLKLSAEEVESRISTTADILGLGALLDRKPAQLSGGQRQRVAMGRAMVRTPQVFLFDEPLSNLDAKLRTQVRLEIGKLHKRLGTTVLYVTHDQIEAMTLADKIVIMHDGYVEQVGTPEEVYKNPNSIFVATFIGSPAMNLLSGRVSDGCFVGCGLRLPISQRIAGKITSGQEITIGVRPKDVSVTTDPGEGSTEATVDVMEYLGDDALLDLKLAESEIVASVPANTRPDEGDQVYVRFNPDHMHIFSQKTGLAIRSEGN